MLYCVFEDFRSLDELRASIGSQFEDAKGQHANFQSGMTAGRESEEIIALISSVGYRLQDGCRAARWEFLDFCAHERRRGAFVEPSAIVRREPT
jgi:hypothetical protein